jgi:hypothetical protein
MNETQRRRITVASSLNEISTTQLETRLLVANFPFLPTAEPEFANVLGLGAQKSTPPGYIHRPAESIPWNRFLGSFLAYGQIFKDDIDGFSFTGDLCFIVLTLWCTRNLTKILRKLFSWNQTDMEGKELRPPLLSRLSEDKHKNKKVDSEGKRTCKGSGLGRKVDLEGKRTWKERGHGHCGQ